MKKIVDLTFAHWKWIVLFTLLATLFFAISIKNIRIDNSIETITVDGDPDLELLLEMEEVFGTDEFIVIAFSGEDIFSPKVLQMIERITNRIRNMENIEGVLSLSNAMMVEDRPEGFGAYPFVPKESFSSHVPDSKKKEIVANRLYDRWIVSEEGKITAIMVWISPVGNDDTARWAIVHEVNQIIDDEKDQRKFHIYGLPVYQKAIIDSMLRDQYYLTSTVFFIIGLILYAMFRDMKLIIIPFILISICSLWSLGLLVFCGSTLNYVTNILPIVLLIVCICGAVHIMTHYKEVSGQAADKISAIKSVISSIGIPILLTGVTTSVGFISLASNGIKPVRDFGVFTGIGVLWAVMLSLTILPLIMSVLNFKSSTVGNQSDSLLMDRILQWIGEITFKWKYAILILSIGGVAVAVAGMMKIEVRQDIVSMLKNTAALDEADMFVDTHMAGSCEFDILVEAEGDYALLEPVNMRRIEIIQQRAGREVPFFRKTVSILDILKEMNQAINDNDPSYYRIPDSKEEALELLEISFSDDGSVDLSSLINDDYTKARIRMFSESGDNSHEANDAMDAYAKIAREENGSDFKVAFAGRPKVFFNMVDSLIAAMIKSFSLAFAVIFIIMIVVFRSFMIGIVSMIINIIPAIITFGIIGWLNIPLNLMTAMVPSIAIGIAVDDTIHLIWRLKKEIQIDGDYNGAILRSLRSVGKPIITTSLVISAGFAVFYFSELVLVTQFGLLTISTVIAALVADLFLGPVLFLIFRPVKVQGESGEHLMGANDLPIAQG